MGGIYSVVSRFLSPDAPSPLPPPVLPSILAAPAPSPSPLDFRLPNLGPPLTEEQWTLVEELEVRHGAAAERDKERFTCDPHGIIERDLRRMIAALPPSPTSPVTNPAVAPPIMLPPTADDEEEDKEVFPFDP